VAATRSASICRCREARTSCCTVHHPVPSAGSSSPGSLLVAGQGAYAHQRRRPRLPPLRPGPLLIVGLDHPPPAVRERAHFDSQGAT
jgi:hypothetical protein